MFKFYNFEEKLIVSTKTLEGLSPLSTEPLEFNGDVIYMDSNPLHMFRSYFKINSTFDLLEEDLSLLSKRDNDRVNYPKVLVNAIERGVASFVNLEFYRHMELLKANNKKKFRVNVVGLGDVGGTLITGLRLLGGDVIESIGIYDLDNNKVQRWVFECNQILDINNPTAPYIEGISDKELFNCDMFVFCVSVGVPEVGNEKTDVRLVQFEGNKKVLSIYAKMARRENFKGIFAVVSDPVDLLCKVAFNESNKDENGVFDYKGLGSHQVRGYGLGVMNGRAQYFALEDDRTKDYGTHGRAFGPHGEGLIIANSMNNYDEELSTMLTEKTKKANLEVRKAGFKPYIAPALSSGAISIIATLRGVEHYSATFIGGTFMGSRNRNTPYGTELETYNLNESLSRKLKETYDYLNSIYN